LPFGWQFSIHISEKQESPAVADKHMRRESMPTIAPIGCAYNVVADNTGKKFAFPDNKATGRLNDENDDIRMSTVFTSIDRIQNLGFGKRSLKYKEVL